MAGAPRIVVTGLGLVTSIGQDRRTFWDHLLAGRSGISPVESFDTSGYRVHQGGEIQGFEPGGRLERLAPERIGRASQLAAVAAREAFADAGLGAGSPFDPPAERIGVVMGTTSGEPREVERFDDAFAATNALRTRALDYLLEAAGKAGGPQAADVDPGGRGGNDRPGEGTNQQGPARHHGIKNALLELTRAKAFALRAPNRD